MRKVLSFVLVLSLILGSFSFAFGADAKTDGFSDVAGLECEGAVKVLAELGVVNGYTDGTFRPDKVVTRAEMAKLIVVALGLEDYVKGMYPNFNDAKGHWAQNYIAYAASLGIIEGYPDGTFRPNNTVTYQQAATMLVRALGYQDQYLVGTWPASHVNVAMSEGILEDIKATSDGANRGDIARMLYNALTVNMVTYNTFGQEQRANDFMANRLGAYPVDQENDGIADPFVITATAVADAVIDIDEYLGAFATAWVNKDGDIIVIEEAQSQYVTGTFTNDDLNEFKTTEGTTYTLSAKAKEYEYEAKSSAGAKYGGDYEAFVNATDVNALTFVKDDVEYTLAVEISGKLIKNLYSAHEWTAKDWTKNGGFGATLNVIHFEQGDANSIEDDQELNGYKFTLNDDKEIDTNSFALMGADNLDDIEENNVVSIYVAPNAESIYKNTTAGDIVKVEVGTEVVQGKVTRVNTSAGVTKFTIDGTVYESTTGNANDIEGVAIAIGDEGSFYLDYSGKIAVFDEDDNPGTYAVALNDTHPNNSGATGKTTYEQYLLTVDGDDNVFNFKNETQYKGSEAYDTATDSPADIKDQLVRYTTNKAGELMTLKLETTYAASTKLDYSNRILNGKLIIDDAVIFIEDPTDGWYVGSLAELKTDEVLTDIRYATNNKDKIDAIWVPKAAHGLIKTVNKFGLFMDWNDTYNDDDERIFAGLMLQDGKEVEYTTTNDVGLGDFANDSVSKLTYDGDNIKTIEKASVFQSDVIISDFSKPVAEDGAGDKDLVSFDQAALAQYIFGDYKVYYVDGTNGERVDLDPSNSYHYEMIKGADAYKVTLDSSNDFDGFALGKLSDIKEGVYIMLLQLDEDSTNWDTVLYMTKKDFEKANPFNYLTQADENQALVDRAKNTIEGASLEGGVAADANAARTAVQNEVNDLIDSRVTATVNTVRFTAADGETDGSYTFKVTLIAGTGDDQKTVTTDDLTWVVRAQ